MICYLRCQPISEDIRLKKYIQACKKRKVNYLAFTWDRLLMGIYDNNEIQFKTQCLYGQGIKNLFKKLSWQFFLLKELFLNRKKYSVIHACDFDTIFPALLAKFILKKKVIYDIYDAAGTTQSFLQKSLRTLDNIAIKHVDRLILADQERVKQINLSEAAQKKLFVVENVPMVDDKVYPNAFETDGTKISYVGVLDRHRGLENLLECVKRNESIFLYIAGTGTLQDEVKKASIECNRISYYDRVLYSKGLSIMKGSDIICGLYYPYISNHIYAAPNKYFESLYLGVPILTSKGTLVGKKTRTHNTGYTIDSTIKDMENFLLSIDVKSDEYKCIKNNTIQIWDRFYAKYFETTLCNNYIQILNNLNK